MGKLFLFIFLATLIYLALKRGQRSTKSPPPKPTAAEPMVRCGHCMIHVPLSESVPEGDQRYCSEEHRRLGRR
jgi:uncharacterized protein